MLIAKLGITAIQMSDTQHVVVYRRATVSREFMFATLFMQVLQTTSPGPSRTWYYTCQHSVREQPTHTLTSAMAHAQNGLLTSSAAMSSAGILAFRERSFRGSCTAGLSYISSPLRNSSCNNRASPLENARREVPCFMDTLHRAKSWHMPCVGRDSAAVQAESGRAL